MRILSIRHSFESDHSASTYEFFAFNRLSEKQRAAVRELTGESARRHLRFHYQGEWKDIPDGWPEKLLGMGYDVMVSESYDWWTVLLALPHDPVLAERMEAYECSADHAGLHVLVAQDKMLVDCSMVLDYDAAFRMFGDDLFEGLADLFERVRDELLAGDLSVLWLMYERCVGDLGEGPEPAAALSASARALAKIIGSL